MKPKSLKSKLRKSRLSIKQHLRRLTLHLPLCRVRKLICSRLKKNLSGRRASISLLLKSMTFYPLNFLFLLMKRTALSRELQSLKMRQNPARLKSNRLKMKFQRPKVNLKRPQAMQASLMQNVMSIGKRARKSILNL